MKKLNSQERLKKFWSHLGRGFLAFWPGFGEGAGSRTPVTEPKRRQNPKRPPRSSFLPNGSSIFENALAIGILIVGFAATTACQAQNRLMLTSVTNFYNPSNSDDYVPTLIQGTDGMLYGTTYVGGTFDFGTIFRSALSGSFTTLVSFNLTNGAYPSGALVQAPDGNFYGTTTYSYGATTYDSYGTIYRLDSNGVLTTLLTFNQTNGSEGVEDGTLVVGNDGALYGVTERGGPDFTNANNGSGTIFRITTNGDFTTLASFNGTNGVYPEDIIQASDGNFYGVTANYNNPGDPCTVFKMTPDGQINTLVQFNGTNGDSPEAIMQASDGCLYGTTGGGGPWGYGTVFKVTTNGDFTLLASFDGTNGALPEAPLVEVCKGVFYGTAANGGVYPNGPAFDTGDQVYSEDGTLFRVTTNGDLTASLSFGDHYEFVLPGLPNFSFIKATDGNFYGGSEGPNQGSIFCVRPVQAPVLQASGQGNQLNLNWNSWLGYTYDVMYETNLAGSNWNLLSTVTAQTNGMTSVSDSIGPDTQRFYSVILQLH